MVTRGELKTVIDTWAAWLASCHQESLARTLSLSVPKQGALALIGVRRSGKSFAAANLLKPYRGQSLCINFEDPLFIQNNDVTVFDELVSVFTEFSRVPPSFLLFDEIHNIVGWERWVRKMVDLRKLSIILTGSSAKMLSSELATALTGRALPKTVWPLSFKEYLHFRNQAYQSTDEYLGALRHYMHWEGSPK